MSTPRCCAPARSGWATRCGRPRRRLLGPDAWETDQRLADLPHSADFIVVGPDRIVPAKLALQQFGKAARTYQFPPYTIMVWNKNLIAELNH